MGSEMKGNTAGDTITVKSREGLEKATTGKGHRAIVAAQILALVAASKGRPITKGDLVVKAASLIEATPQGTVQGGSYVTRYYVSEMAQQGILAVTKAPREPKVKESKAEKPPRPADRQQAAQKTA